MTALPATSDFTSSGVTEGAFKTAFGELRAFLAGLLGADGSQATALAALGALAGAYVAKTAAYTVTTDDRGKAIGASGTWTLALPAAATAGAGFAFALRNTGSGTITVDPSGAETIDGSATLAFGPERGNVIVSTGTEWITLGHRTQTGPADTTPGRLMTVGAFGWGSDAGIQVTALDAHQLAGNFFGLGGAHATPSTGSNPFPTLNGAFGLFCGNISIGSASEYLYQIATSFSSTSLEMKVRTNATTGWSDWKSLLLFAPDGHESDVFYKKITIADDAVGLVDLPRIGGFLSITPGGDSNSMQNLASGMVLADGGSSNATTLVWGAANFAVSASELTGTTGADNSVTVHVKADQTMQIENRRGLSLNFIVETI